MCAAFFNVCGVTVITVLLQIIDHRGPQTCPWLKIVTNFYFLGGATELKFWDLAPRPNTHRTWFISDLQRLWSVCAYAQVGLRLCWAHIPHCWKSHDVALIIRFLASLKGWVFTHFSSHINFTSINIICKRKGLGQIARPYNHYVSPFVHGQIVKICS